MSHNLSEYGLSLIQGFQSFAIQFAKVQNLWGQWKFSVDKHKSLQVDTERTFHQRYPLVML